MGARRLSPGALPLPELIGASAVMRTLRAAVRAAAGSRAGVLVTGETGTGKNVVARAIHRLSAWAARPFVQVDCAALAPGLIESELFGHARGSFTGAVERRIGRLEVAADGTLFLDEVGELEPRLQTRFLRALEEREFEPLGSNATQRLRARIVAATSRPLEHEVAMGRFRADLYYRLCVLRLCVPPLRTRPEDLAALAEIGLQRAARSLGVAAPALEAEALERLRVEAWPGNVRQLFNVLEAALVRRPQGPLDTHALDLVLRAPAAGLVGARSERDRMAAALRATGGNVSRAARQLGLARSTLRYRLARLGVRG